MVQQYIQEQDGESIKNFHLTEKLIIKHKFVVVYPYKFSDFLYNLLELDNFKQYCDVSVWDISMITTPDFSKAIRSDGCRKREVAVILSFWDFVGRVRELRRQSNEANICILNEVTYSSLKEMLCNLVITILLKRKSITIFDLYNGGVPIHYPNSISLTARTRISSFIANVRFFVEKTSTFHELIKKTKSAFLISLSRFIPHAVTHRLVAGEDWLMLSQTKSRRDDSIKIVFGHSHDYSNHLLSKPGSFAEEASSNKVAVFLDASSPMFKGDSALLGHRDYLTSDVWYPALTRFFDRLEAEAGVKVEIAGHYKSTHPAIAPCFGNRPVHYGKTGALVCNSEFVITRTSTAISYAVIFRKPVIFIYSNQQKEDRKAMRDILGMAAMLGSKPVNIDEPPVEEMISLLKVNEERYLNYEKTCLTSSNSHRPNVQIILEDIMNIKTGSGFAKTSPNWTIK